MFDVIPNMPQVVNRVRSNQAFRDHEMRSIFPLSRCQRNLMLLFSRYKTLSKTKSTREFHVYCWYHICKVNECCLVECFHREFRISTQDLYLNDYCIARCKKFSACEGLLLALWAIFLRFKMFTLIRTRIYQDSRF